MDGENLSPRAPRGSLRHEKPPDGRFLIVIYFADARFPVRCRPYNSLPPLAKGVAYKRLSEDRALTTATVVEQEPVAQKAFKSRSPRQLAWMRFKRNRAGILAAAVAIFFVVCAFGAPLICSMLGISPTVSYRDELNEFGLPAGAHGGISLSHPLGIEPGAGRDVLAMLLYGSRISFTLAIIASVSTIGLGLLIGTLIGYYRGWVDATIGRFADFLLAFPTTFMIVALSLPMTQRIEALDIGLRDNTARITVLILFFTLFGWPGFTRLIRSQVLSLRERDFVMAAKSMGASTRRIVFKELLPNLWSPVIVFLSLALPGYLAAEAVFSFLGVGVQAPATTWGLVLADGISYWKEVPGYLIIPSVMLVIIVLALNVLGDAIRDALDPKADRA